MRRKLASLTIALVDCLCTPQYVHAQEVDLSPRAAAHGAVSTPSLDDGGAPSTPVAAAAVARPPLFATRPQTNGDIQLEKRRNGTFRYNGNGFDALIRRDGSIEMHDKLGKVECSLKPVQFLNGTWGFSFLRRHYDLFALLDKLFGNDPHRSERRRFMLGTRALRDRLASEAQAGATGALTRELEQIWSASGLSFAARRRRTFELWEQQADDELGAIGRGLIVRFVQQRCPLDSACAFTEQELRELNTGRAPANTFAPYPAAGPAAGRDDSLPHGRERE